MPTKYYQSIQHPFIYNLIGKSILASGGEPWTKQRRLLNPLFLKESLKVTLMYLIKEKKFISY